ncbi:MAG: YceI family protein [Planctomycetota bacterium]|jgi:polyisoprenoid-binding protein YceI
MNRNRLMTITCLVILPVTSVWAAPKFEFEIDPDHSSVTFKVMHEKLHWAHGRFNEISGVLTLDNRKKPKNITITATVMAKSVDTANRERDKHLRKKDFFDAKKFKEITFVANECNKVSDDRFELTGDMTMLGKTVPMTVNLQITGLIKGKGKHNLGAESTFIVKPSEFGMPPHDGIGDEVSVTVSLKATYKMPPAG